MTGIWVCQKRTISHLGGSIRMNYRWNKKKLRASPPSVEQIKRIRCEDMAIIPTPETPRLQASAPIRRNPSVQTDRPNTPRSKSTRQMSVLHVKDEWLFQGRRRTHTHEKKEETFKNNSTATWKMTLWAWQINCRIKVLMGNKESKNSYSSLWNRIKITRFSTCPPPPPTWVIVQWGSGGSSADNAAVPEIDESGNASSFLTKRWSRPLLQLPCQSAKETVYKCLTAKHFWRSGSRCHFSLEKKAQFCCCSKFLNLVEEQMEETSNHLSALVTLNHELSTYS